MDYDLYRDLRDVPLIGEMLAVLSAALWCDRVPSPSLTYP